jgi:hypothetical protein
MRAILYHGNRDLRPEDIEEPTCQPDQVKIKCAFNGVCGSVRSPRAAFRKSKSMRRTCMNTEGVWPRSNVLLTRCTDQGPVYSAVERQ